MWIRDSSIYKINPEQLSEALLHEQQILMQETYKEPRIVVRPKKNVTKDIVYILISVLLTSSMIAILCYMKQIFSLQPYLFYLGISVSVLLFGMISLKRILLTLITLYQKYAPDTIRDSCLFEPSCSEYMRISIEKYGVLKGCPKGLKRLSRCHLPNGGIDEP